MLPWHNISCHFTLPHNQKVAVFASSKDEKDREDEIIISGSLFRTEQFLLQEGIHDSFHHSRIPSTARENLYSVITKASSETFFFPPKAKESPRGTIQSLTEVAYMGPPGSPHPMHMLILTT